MAPAIFPQPIIQIRMAWTSSEDNDVNYPFVSSEVEKRDQSVGQRFSTSLETNGIGLSISIR